MFRKFLLDKGINYDGNPWSECFLNYDITD